MTDNVIIIPTRLEASRLPGKPLKKINNIEMILHVYKAAKEADVGEVIVASPNDQINELIKSKKGLCIKTRANHKTGTDRIFEIFDKYLKKKPNLIINLQGDMPNIKPETIQYLSKYMEKNLCDIGTLSSEFNNESEINNVNNVKVLTDKPIRNNNFENAVDFFRTNDKKENGYIYHHIGIYAFTNEALLRYVRLNQTNNELERNLEQLRALDNNMKIHVGYTTFPPLSVDTEEDLNKIKRLMK